MKKKSYLLRLIPILFVLTVILWIFCPRNLAQLARIQDGEIVSVTLHGFFQSTEEPHTVKILTKEQAEELFSMLESTYVYRAPLASEVSNGGEDYVGYAFEMPRAAPFPDDVPPMLFYFTKDTVSIDGVSYHLYGDAFDAWFTTLIGSVSE